MSLKVVFLVNLQVASLYNGSKIAAGDLDELCDLSADSSGDNDGRDAR